MLPAMMRLSRKEVAEGQGQGKRQDQGQEVEEAAAAAAAKHGLWEKLVCVVKGQGRHWRAGGGVHPRHEPAQFQEAAAVVVPELLLTKTKTVAQSVGSVVASAHAPELAVTTCRRRDDKGLGGRDFVARCHAHQEGTSANTGAAEMRQEEEEEEEEEEEKEEEEEESLFKADRRRGRRV